MRINVKPSHTKRPTRIGPKMRAVVDFVRRNPGCTKLAAAKWAWGLVGVRALRMSYMYGPVDRAIAAGLIVAERTKGGAYALRVAE
jgi:hypothetical protein